MKLFVFFGIILLIGTLLLVFIHVFHVSYINDIGGSYWKSNIQGYNNTIGLYTVTSNGVMVKDVNNGEIIGIDKALEKVKKKVQFLKNSVLRPVSNDYSINSQIIETKSAEITKPVNSGGLTPTFRGGIVHNPINNNDHNNGQSSHNNHHNVVKPISQNHHITEDHSWHKQLLHKLYCLHQRKGDLFLYHIRKAAGTTLREIMTKYAKINNVRLYESGGISLNREFLSVKGLLSVITLRHPVHRVLSLYWYEHVAWYATITKDLTKIKTLHEWVSAWKDGSEWKDHFVVANPRSLYVEIENYYVKSLIGWNGKKKLTDEDLEYAKSILAKFDVILFQEWMNDETQLSITNKLFPGRMNIAINHAVKGDVNIKNKYGNTYAKDLDRITADLTAINYYDLQLFEFAQLLAIKRFAKMNDVIALSHKPNVSHITNIHELCVVPALTIDLKRDLGIFRPKGHKGP